MHVGHVIIVAGLRVLIAGLPRRARALALGARTGRSVVIYGGCGVDGSWLGVLWWNETLADGPPKPSNDGDRLRLVSFLFTFTFGSHSLQ